MNAGSLVLGADGSHSAVAAAVANIVPRLQVTSVTMAVVRAALERQNIPSETYSHQWLRSTLRDHVIFRLQPMFPTAEADVLAVVLDAAVSIEQAIRQLTMLHPQRPSVALCENIALLPEVLSIMMQYIGMESISVRLVCKTWRDALSEWRVFSSELTRTSSCYYPVFAAVPAAGGLVIAGHDDRRNMGRASVRYMSRAEAFGEVADSRFLGAGVVVRKQSFSGGIACDGDTCYLAEASRLSAFIFSGASADVVPVPQDAVRYALDEPDVHTGAASGLVPLHPGETQFHIAEGLTVAAGEVFLCDRLHHRVIVYNASSMRPVRSFGAVFDVDARYQTLQQVAQGQKQWHPAELDAPVDIAVLGNEAFVADFSRKRVVVFGRASGKYAREVGPFDEGVEGIAIVPQGHSALAHALLLVTTATKTHVHILASGKPWQVVPCGGKSVCYAPEDRRAYVIGDGSIHILCLRRLAEVANRSALQRKAATVA